jgi:hypothetical protein
VSGDLAGRECVQAGGDATELRRVGAADTLMVRLPPKPFRQAGHDPGQHFVLQLVVATHVVVEDRFTP